MTDPTGASGVQGHVSDWSLCLPFSESGEDQSFNVRIDKHLEYFNDFSSGVYDMGDVTLSDYTVYGSNKGLYWKTYRRGEGSGPLCEGCRFVETGAEAPGGSGHVAFEDTEFYWRGGEDIQINHHCHVDNDTGGLCASHFDFRTASFFRYDHPTQAYEPGSPLIRSGKLPTASLVFLPEGETLLHADASHNSVAFDLDGYLDNDTCRPESERVTQAGWYACHDDLNSGGLGLRIVRIYSPDRGELTVTNHSEQDTAYAIPFTQHGLQNGGATKMGYILNCSGPQCANYMQTSGYVFVVPADSELSLSFETLLDTAETLSDLLALEYSDQQVLPETSITIRAVEGTGIMDVSANCTISSSHSRAFITPYGPVHGAAGALYNECAGQWALKFTMADFINGSYGGSGVPPTGGGDDLGDVEPPQAEPTTPSNWPSVSHPSADQVVSMYSGMYSDAFDSTLDEVSWFPPWSPQSAYLFDILLDAESSNPGDRILKVTLPGGVNWFGLFEFPGGQTLNLLDYDRLRFEVWTSNVTSLSVKARDYGLNGVWDAALDDVDTAKPIALDDNLIAGQWSTIDIDLNDLFGSGAARNLGQLIIQDIVAPGGGGDTVFYLQNIYFYWD